MLLFSQNTYACFGALANSMSQGISQKYNLEKERTDALMKLAEQRFKTAKDCREELQKAWVDFRKEKMKLEREIAKEGTDVEAAEIEYEQEVLKLKGECEAHANEEFAKYKQGVYSVPVGDPTALASFENTVNKGWITFYTNCWRGVHQGGGLNNRQQQVKLLARKLANKVQAIRDNTNAAKEALRELHAVTTQVQATTQRNCADADDLQEYNEALLADIHAKGMAAAQQTSALSALGAVMSCLTPTGQQQQSDTTTNGATPNAL